MPTTDTITRETTLCISLAARPSNIGTRFHNFLYDELDLNYLYKAFAPTDIAGAISGVRALGIRGCAVSMPYKEHVIPLVDELDASASAIQSVNTIVNTDGHLRAYNTDYLAVTQVLASHQVPTDDDFAVRGSGGMAKAVVAALRDSGFRNGHIIARDENAGHTLAEQYGFRSTTQIGDLRPRLIINATPIGMTGGPKRRRPVLRSRRRHQRRNRLRRRRVPRHHATDHPGRQPREEDHQRRRRHRPAGRRTIRPVHGNQTHTGPTPPSKRILQGLTTGGDLSSWQRLERIAEQQ